MRTHLETVSVPPRPPAESEPEQKKERIRETKGGGGERRMKRGRRI
jgi:hypothetical protein